MKSAYIKLLFLGIVLVLLTISLLTYRNLLNYNEEVESIRHSNDVLATLEIVMSQIKDAETGHRGYQLTRDTFYLEPYFTSLKTLPGQLVILDSLARYNVLQNQKVDTLLTLTNNQFFIISKILTNARRSTLYMDRYESDLMLEGKRNMDQIRKVAGRIRKAEELLFKTKLSTETGIRNIAPIALLLYGLVALAGMGLLFSRVLDELEKRQVAESTLKDNIQILKEEVSVREFTQRTLRNVLDTSLDGIMAFRSVRNKDNTVHDFEWLLTNPVSVRLLGQTESMTGKYLLEIMPAYKTEGLFDIFKGVVESGRPQQFEKFYNPNGQRSWFRITTVKLDDGFVVTFSDITEQKSQRIIREERELLLKEAEQVANLGSWKWTEKNDELIWSDGMYAIMGKSASDGSPTWDSFLENVYIEDQPLMQDFLTALKTNGEEVKLDYRIQLAKRIHYLSMVAKPRQFPDGALLGTVIDITEGKVYENQLKQYTTELQRSNKELEQFAYVASHDLQEPLRKIRAFGDRLTSKYSGKLTGSGEDYIARMQLAAARMQTLIEDLLSFSRVSRNIAVYEWLDTSVLVGEVIDNLDAQIKRESAVVRVNNLPRIKGDKAQIVRLFQNLISNGIKFHKPAERPLVVISGKVVKNSEVLSEFDHKPTALKYARIVVKDHGIGFEEQYLEKMFTIFQRLHGRNEFEGTGIGLSICRKIVVNHEGFITAKSELRAGSEFIVIFPIE